MFLSLGGILEILHGFKVGWYVDVGNEMRRLMFTLAHAHGTALALVNIAAGLTSRVKNLPARISVSFSLIWAGVLFPMGFFLGGVVSYSNDVKAQALGVPRLRLGIQAKHAHSTGLSSREKVKRG